MQVLSTSFSSASRTLGQTSFVGRKSELAKLRDTLDAAAAGLGRVVLIAGEPGVGKTRVALELAALAEARGWHILFGRSYESEGMPAYLPFVEAVQDYLRASSTDDVRAALGSWAVQLGVLVPELPERVPRFAAPTLTSPELERYRLFEAVSDFFLRIASARPDTGLVFVVDDLHWSDRASLLLLSHLARRIGDARILIIGTVRTEELIGNHPLNETLAQLTRERRLERISLKPLGREEALTLIGATAGLVPDVRVAAAIYREASGNPFFLEAMVRHLQSEGHSLDKPETAVGKWGIPEDLRQVINHRLSRVGTPTNRVLQAAAVLDAAFDLAVIANALDLTPGAVTECVEEALNAGLVRADGVCQFSHALVRQTIYAEIPLPRKQHLHLRISEAIETVHRRNLRPYIATLAAHHVAAGEAADAEKTVRFCEAAGSAAKAVFAWEDAIRHYEAALRVAEDSGVADERSRCELLLELGDARRCLGEGEFRSRGLENLRQAAEIARRLDDPVYLARAALGSAPQWGAPLTAEDPLLALFEEALAALGGAHNGLRIRLLAWLSRAYFYIGQLEPCERYAQSAVTLAKQFNDKATLGHALGALGRTLFRTDQATERARVATEAQHLSEAAGDFDNASVVEIQRVGALIELGDFEQASRVIDGYTQMAERARSADLLWSSAAQRGMRAVVAGRFAEAEEHLQTIITISGEFKTSFATSFIQNLRTSIRRETGTLDETDLGAVPPAARFYGRARRVDVMAKLGQLVEASRDVEAITADLHRFRRDQDFVVSLCLLTEACTVVGDARSAEVICGSLEPFASYFAVMSFAASGVCLGAVPRYLGLLAAMLGRPDEAAHHFEAAIAMNSGIGARPLVAHCQHEYASFVLGRQPPGVRPASARSLLQDAFATFEELGMRSYAAEVRRKLTAADSGRAATRRVYPAGLSEREVEVLRLIAAGRSNPEIAAELVLSRNTVQRHVSNILAKGGLTNRAEAAAYAQRQNLL